MDIYDDPHLEYVTCPISLADDLGSDAVAAISSMPTFSRFLTLHVFRLDGAWEIDPDDGSDEED